MIPEDSIKSSIPESSKKYDVIVAGGGPAGLGAAMACSRQGVKTLLLEARPQMGGTKTSTFWMPMNRMVKNGKPRGGVHDLIVDKLKNFGPDAWMEGKKDWINGDGFHFHPAYFCLGILELLEECGCHYRLYSPVTGVIMENGRKINSVISIYKEKQIFQARYFIDASGDGDLSFYAGTKMSKGRENDGVHLPMTLAFLLGNCDSKLLFKYLDYTDGPQGNDYVRESNIEFQKLLKNAKQAGFSVSEWYSFDITTIPGVLSVNNGGVYAEKYLDGTSPADLTFVERMGLEIATDFVHISRKYEIPGLDKCYLLQTAPWVSIRDTRRLVGEYVQTYEDSQEGKLFPDTIAKKYGAVDGNQIFLGTMVSGFGYPYRSMIPKEIDNLFVAGRCGSATFLGHAAGKSMGNMMAIGQAAGIAAALCCQRGTIPRELNHTLVQEKLILLGVEL